MRHDQSPGTPPEGEGSVVLFLTSSRARLVLSGEIDVTLRGEIGEAMDEALEASLPIEIDTRGVTFMDSSGVSMLARLSARAPDRLQLIDPPEQVRFLLDLTRIGQLVDIVEADPGFPFDPDPDPGVPAGGVDRAAD
ncbi:STAS domain-containing protein [Actinotalea sp. BY-33]|uniref:STAS domain-containing protein n=1 Tax=Actinotalea soli TaxID=2819234 RepID=A0A939LQ39_9CELL|nr:STAS domain-containing protein [Actinotalea soli]MBO1751683.1 STAS domain-containing protein [Actinotalea soli]